PAAARGARGSPAPCRRPSERGAGLRAGDRAERERGRARGARAPPRRVVEIAGPAASVLVRPHIGRPLNTDMEAPMPKPKEDRNHQAWTLVLASLGVFMTALDTLVVTTSLPVLRLDLHASLSSLEWTVNAYNLAFACLLLTGAALGDRFGRRRMFVVGLGVFTVASAASALSPSIGALIAARAFQGAGAAVVTPL